MWTLIFSLETNRGVCCDRQAGTGEYSRVVAKELCGFFRETPSRYEWTGTQLREFPGWEAERAAISLESAKARMTAAIIAEEDRRTWLPIEHPALSGIWHKTTMAISDTIDRLSGASLEDPLPINGGFWDDVNGNPIPFTLGDLIALRNAIYDRGAYNYGVRKFHIAEMLKLADPESYDFSAGWAA